MSSLAKEILKSNDFEGESLFIGIDVHKKRWAVTLRMAGNELKTFSMNPSPEELISHVGRHYPGARYVSAYEAGFSGFWIHEALSAAGFTNLIVHPADVPVTNKERTYKTDRRDARKLARSLENRIKGHLALYGHTIPPTRTAWSGAFLKALEEIEFQSEAGRCYLAYCLEGLGQAELVWLRLPESCANR